jgi:hypothetical protein
MAQWSISIARGNHGQALPGQLASQTGVVVGTVANMMSGKGVASAFGPRGMYMSCEYQMNTPYQGAGSCTFSNGAKYQLHLGGN